MTASDMTDELVEKCCRALMRSGFTRVFGEYPENEPITPEALEDTRAVLAIATLAIREECAKIAEGLPSKTTADERGQYQEEATATEAAAAIRAGRPA